MYHPHLCLAVLVALSTPPESSSSASTSFNLCSEADLCCRHRDSGCVVQKVLANHSVDTSRLPCYCDQAIISKAIYEMRPEN